MKRKKEIDKKAIEDAMRVILKAINEDIARDGLKDTPHRIAQMYEEIFAGIIRDPKRELTTYVAKNEDEMIIIKDIPSYSMCEHHLLPFFDKAHIVYIPKANRITGFSSLVRVIDDGMGFDPQQAGAAGHFGLTGMRERAALVGGALTVTSEPGSGTVVQLTIEDYAK